MWDEIVANLAGFSSVVVTGVDAAGYPVSARCVPQVDPTQKVLHLSLPAALFQAGPASLLGHALDEHFWNLKNFGVQGQLEKQAEGWVFRPQRFILGIGEAVVLANAAQTASQYLAKRNLPRPAIQWEAIHALHAELKQNKPTGD